MWWLFDCSYGPYVVSFTGPMTGIEVLCLFFLFFVCFGCATQLVES